MRALSRRVFGTFMAAGIMLLAGTHSQAEQQAKSAAPLVWTGWGPIGGQTKDAPGATSYQGKLYSFVRGLNNGIWVNIFNGSGWTGWAEIAGGGRTLSGPAATVYQGTLRLFVRGTDNGLWVNVFNGFGWNGWSLLPGGGLTNAAPGVTVYKGRLQLFVRGVAPFDAKIFVNTLIGASWSGWGQVPGGGETPSGPDAAVYKGKLHLFVQGTDNGVWRNTESCFPWGCFWPTGWGLVPYYNQSTPDSPAAATFKSSLYVFVRDADRKIYFNRLKGFWYGWSEVPGGGRTPSGPAAAAYFNHLYLLVRGDDDQIWVNRL